MLYHFLTIRTNISRRNTFMKSITLALIGIFIIPSTSAYAMFFQPQIDQCAYTDGGQWFGGSGTVQCGTTFQQERNVAYAFTLDQELTVSRIEGWIKWNDPNPSTLDTVGANVVVYNDSRLQPFTGPIPGTNRIFQQGFSFQEDKSDSDMPLDWRGVENTNVVFNPGKYWVAFEGGTRNLFVSGSNGVRLQGVTTPEPSTLLLLGGGLFGVLWRRKFSKK